MCVPLTESAKKAVSSNGMANSNFLTISSLQNRKFVPKYHLYGCPYAQGYFIHSLGSAKAPSGHISPVGPIYVPNKSVSATNTSKDEKVDSVDDVPDLK
jgi:hypothetical protein